MQFYANLQKKNTETLTAREHLQIKTTSNTTHALADFEAETFYEFF